MSAGIIGVICIAFIMIGMVLGLIRGWVHTLIRLGEIILAGFLAYFIAGSLAKAVMSLDISQMNLNIAGVEVTTVEGTLSSLLSSVKVIQEVVDASPTIKSIITILPLIIVNLVLFVILFFVIKGVGWLLHQLIRLIIAKTNKKKNAYNGDDEDKRKNTGRLIGAGLGVLQGFLCFAIALMPVAGISYFLADEVAYVREYKDGTLTESTNNTQSIAYASESESEEKEETLEDAEATINEINGNAGFKILSLFGYNNLAKASVEGLTSFELNGVETSLTTEVDNFIKIYVRVEDLLEVPIDSWTTKETNLLNETIDLFFASPISGDITTELVHVVADKWTSEEVDQSFLGLAKPSIDGDGEEVLDVFLKQLKGDSKNELKGELQAVVNVFKVGIDSGIIEVVKTSTTIEDVIEPLAKEGVVEDIIGAMVSGRAIKNTLPTVVQFGLNQLYPMLGVSEESYDNLKITKAASEINWETEKVYLGNTFSGLARVYISLQKEGEVLEKLDYHSLALALDNLRKSELLNSKLANGNTLSKEITLILLNSSYLGALDGMDSVLNEIETGYKNVDFYSLLKTLKTSVQLADSLDKLNKGEIEELPADQVSDLLNGLANEKTGELVKDLASSENLKGLGIDETTSITVGSLVSAVVDYNKNANSGGDNPEVQTMPTDAEGIGKATESFKDLADVVQTGISNSANTDAEYIFFASKEEMREFILSLQSSPYVYEVALSSGSTLGFTDMVGYTKLTDTEYSYLEELIEEDPVTFNEVKMKTIFGVKKSA